jgi:hypothetical protein
MNQVVEMQSPQQPQQRQQTRQLQITDVIESTIIDTSLRNEILNIHTGVNMSILLGGGWKSVVFQTTDGNTDGEREKNAQTLASHLNLFCSQSQRTTVKPVKIVINDANTHTHAHTHTQTEP